MSNKIKLMGKNSRVFADGRKITFILVIALHFFKKYERGAAPQSLHAALGSPTTENIQVMSLAGHTRTTDPAGRLKVLIFSLVQI